MMKIYKSSVSWDDSFQELLSMWKEDNLCEIIDSPENVTWANELGDILLYEHDRLDKLPIDWNYGLFGNEIHHGDKSIPWIYWARHPKKLEDCVDEGIYNYDQRDIESIFLGKVENPIQYQKRTKKDWSDSVDIFSMPIELGISGHYKFSNEEYLRTIRRAKFGLCLSGHGPKCQREIELMGLGVVPIFTEGVSNEYFEPLRENHHYFYAEYPEQIENIIKSCTKEHWREMSFNCVDWYFRNCSREGSLETTQYIIENRHHK
jgi:hypothetical protein